MRILVTGSKGQMGQEFQVISEEDGDNSYLFTDIDDLDITDARAVSAFLLLEQPDAIINCAGYTAVDQAEQEPEKAMLINGTAVEILSRAAGEAGILLIHISTDYVFDGTSYTPYTESAIPNPVSVYGKSKFSGEQAMHLYASKGIIIRTSWLFSSFGNNFVKTIIRYGRERDTLNVVYDQIGSPTFAKDLCLAIRKILPSLYNHRGVDIYHFCNEGIASWYDFAMAIADLTALTCQILPVASKDYNQLALRPFYSVLDKSLIKKRFGIKIPYWRESLAKCILELKAMEVSGSGL